MEASAEMPTDSTQPSVLQPDTEMPDALIDREIPRRFQPWWLICLHLETVKQGGVDVDGHVEVTAAGFGLDQVHRTLKKASTPSEKKRSPLQLPRRSASLTTSKGNRSASPFKYRASIAGQTTSPSKVLLRCHTPDSIMVLFFQWLPKQLPTRQTLGPLQQSANEAVSQRRRTSRPSSPLRHLTLRVHPDIF